MKGNELSEQGLYEGYGQQSCSKKMVIYDFKKNLGDSTKRKAKQWNEDYSKQYVQGSNNYGDGAITNIGQDLWSINF